MRNKLWPPRGGLSYMTWVAAMAKARKCAALSGERHRVTGTRIVLRSGRVVWTYRAEVVR